MCNLTASYSNGTFKVIIIKLRIEGQPTNKCLVHYGKEFRSLEVNQTPACL